jgi:formate hydrogenlyase subunit 3/multisubunit Na+/H+ antiporter MnhD subunit
MVIKINIVLSFILMVAGALAVVLPAIKALSQDVIRKRLLYHAISQAGYVALGIGTLTSIGTKGSILGAVNGVICLGWLFFAARCVHDRPALTFAFWLIASLSVSAVFPLPGFFSVWMICRGLAQNLANPAGRFTIFLCLSAAVFGAVVTLAGFMRLTQTVFFNKNEP